MVRASNRRGATRKPVKKQRNPIVIPWMLWFRTTLIVSMLSITVASIVWLQRDDTLPILYVTVDGEFNHVDKNKLVAAVKPFVTGNFININVAKLKQAAESTPWVKQIQVKRSWPDTVHLVVEEQQAIANWGQNALVNSDGQLFYPSKASFPSGLAVLEGSNDVSKLMVKRFIDLSDRLKTTGLAIKKLELDARRAWTLKLDNNITVKLGRADSDNRLNRLLSVYSSRLAQFEDDIKIIDMRYTNGLAINWKSGHQPEFNGAV
jgi:cell division protein FtsQ